MRVPWLISRLFVVAALLIAACTDAASTSDADRPADVGSLEPAATARPDGLTGAPLPAAVGDSAAFDASRLDANALPFPPLTDVGVVPAGDASWLQPDTLVLGAVQGAEARAYPLFIMQLHHVANDVLGGKPHLATF